MMPPDALPVAQDPSADIETTVDVDQLRQLHEAATEAPWAWEATGDKDNSWGLGVVSDDDGNLLAGNIEPGEHEVIDPVCEAIDGNQADAALIAAMRNQLGALLDAYGELTGLRAENERLRATEAENKRFDAAVDIVLNSGLLAPHMDDFWAFCDGEIDEDEARERLPR